MTHISIPGPVTNDLRQGLTLRMGDAAQALEEASLIDRRERSYETFAEHFEQIDAIRDLFDALGWEHVEADPANVEIDLDDHREALEAGLDEAIMMVRTFTTEGSPQDRQQAVIDLAQVERFAASLGMVA
jgi:hypothetical protein